MLLHSLLTGLYHKLFHHLHLLLSLHLHLHINLVPGMLVPTLVIMAVHGAEGGPAISPGVNLLHRDLAHVTDMINFRRLLANYLTSRVMNTTH